MESRSNQKSVKQIQINFIFWFFKVATLCHVDSFAHSCHSINQVHPEGFSTCLEEFPTYAEHTKPSHLGWGRVIVEARSSDAALFQSLYWSNSPYTAWMCVGSLSCWKKNDSPTKRKPDGMAYRCRMQCYQQSTITPPPPCFTVGTTHMEIIRSPTLRLTKTRLDPTISNLDSSDQRTDFHWLNVHCSCFLA